MGGSVGCGDGAMRASESLNGGSPSTRTNDATSEELAPTCRWNMSFSISMPATHSERCESPIGERMPATDAQDEMDRGSLTGVLWASQGVSERRLRVASAPSGDASWPPGVCGAAALNASAEARTLDGGRNTVQRALQLFGGQAIRKLRFEGQVGSEPNLCRVREGWPEHRAPLRRLVNPWAAASARRRSDRDRIGRPRARY